MNDIKATTTTTTTTASIVDEIKENKTEQSKEIFDITNILASIKEDNISTGFDIKKHENDDEMKKMRKKYKKLKNDVSQFYSGKMEPKDKIISIFDKFQKLSKDCKALNEKFILVRSNYNLAHAEREKAQEDHRKVLNVNTALENFCKDLQKQNVDLVELHKKLQNDEKEIRTKLAEEFQQKINDISNNLEKQVLENLQKSKENEILKEKLKEVQEKYDSREIFFAQEMKNREKQINDHNEKIIEKFNEIENEAKNIEAYKEKLENAKAEDTEWKKLLQMYLDKAMEFNQTMTKANEFFAKVKGEMERMSKKITMLDTQNIELQKKAEKTDVAITDLIEENIRLNKDLDKEKTQTEGLESLCKKLEEDIAKKNAAILQLKSKADKTSQQVSESSQTDYNE